MPAHKEHGSAELAPSLLISTADAHAKFHVCRSKEAFPKEHQLNMVQ